jgi:hypothetical protein
MRSDEKGGEGEERGLQAGAEAKTVESILDGTDWPDPRQHFEGEQSKASWRLLLPWTNTLELLSCRII